MEPRMKLPRVTAARWFAARVGMTVDTVQVQADTGAQWAPGPRTIEQKGSRFVLNGSSVSFTPDHVVVAADDTSLTIRWNDETGRAINVTTYTEIEGR